MCLNPQLLKLTFIKQLNIIPFQVQGTHTPVALSLITNRQSLSRPIYHLQECETINRKCLIWCPQKS